jgi:hypothetical protein
MPKVRYADDALTAEELEALDSLPDKGYDIKHREWSEREDQILLKYYRIKRSIELLPFLPGRSHHSLGTRAAALKGMGKRFRYEDLLCEH